ncbi:uncharacterized protein BDV17DRAFT_251811 [Aspergillus undulatus]|uniref:uncharacterized protein n=1 Tax=Aspergillus undulatus TaxID=1810928 RepID=UPI003CCCF202
MWLWYIPALLVSTALILSQASAAPVEVIHLSIDGRSLPLGVLVCLTRRTGAMHVGSIIPGARNPSLCRHSLANLASLAVKIRASVARVSIRLA